MKSTNKESIDQFMTHVNQTFTQAERMNFKTILKFIILGVAKIAALASILWILRHI